MPSAAASRPTNSQPGTSSRPPSHAAGMENSASGQNRAGEKAPRNCQQPIVTTAMLQASATTGTSGSANPARISSAA